MKIPTIERLHELYEVVDGKLICKVVRPKLAVGQEAGGMRGDGYRRVSIDGQEFATHRVIYAMSIGRWPLLCVDHIDGDILNNCPKNLREATLSQNQLNRVCGLIGTSIHKGVQLDRKTGRWVAHVRIAGKYTYLGAFDSELSAAEAARSARLKHHGEFASDLSRTAA